jgi:UDP-glucose 4-epimerase
MDLGKFHNKNILITGGAGYLAANLITQLRETDCRMIRVDRPGAQFVPVAGKFTLRDIEADIRESAIWERLLDGTDIIFHFAAQTSVYVAEENPQADWAGNVMPMLHLLETCRKKKHHPIVLFSGTVTQAGLTECLPVNEDCADHPVTIYDLHKWIAENYLKHYTRNGIVQGVVLRLANVYGPGPKSSSADRGVLNAMIRNALRGQALTVYGGGGYLRDYVYIEDVSQAFLSAAANIDVTAGNHFVIGSGEGHTILQAINLVARRVAIKTKINAPVVNVDPPAGLSWIETRNFIADTSRFTKSTGWKAKWTLTEGIDASIGALIARGET